MAATMLERANALRDLVRAVVELRDGIGVLSIMVGLEADSSSGGTPAWEIALRNDFTRFRNDDGIGPALERRLDEASTELSEALDPTASGRGRALYIALESGKTIEAMVQRALPTRARVGPVAHVLPLLAVLDEGEPAGLLAASRDAVSVSESELGIVRDVDRIELEPWVGDWWPEMKGPARANPLRGQQTVSQRDRYARRVSAAYRHTLQEAATAIGSLARKRGWTRAVLAGDPRTIDPLGEALRDAGLVTAAVDANLEGLRAEEAAARLQAALESLVAATALERTRLVEEAAARGTGACGLAPVLAALNEARVETLLIDTGRTFVGLAGPEGVLGVVGEGEDGIDLTDLIVSRALSTGVEVTPVSDDAATRLETCGGIGALLRW